MELDIKIRNIVLVGLFQINYFDKYFFFKNGFVSEDEILPNSTFGNLGIVNLHTPKFQILIQLNQVIITSNDPNNDDIKLDEIISKLILDGNIVNVTGLGINFHWFLVDDSQNLQSLSKKLFYSSDVKLLSDFFDSDDSMYGIYASKNVKDARLKLDVKPNILQDNVNNKKIDSIGFAFNFHFDILENNGNEVVLEKLNNYSFYKAESYRMVSIYN